MSYSDATVGVHFRSMWRFGSHGVDAWRRIRKAYITIAKAQERIGDDPTLSEAQKLLRLAALAEKTLGEALAEADRTIGDLTNLAAHKEAELAKAHIEPKAPREEALFAETRAYLRSLSQDERLAVVDSDRTATRAALSAQPYLSGLSAQRQDLLRAQYLREVAPSALQTIEECRSAAEELGRCGQVLLDSVHRNIDFQSARELAGRVSP